MPAAKGQRPDKWIIVDLTVDGVTEKKVFCGNYGGFRGSDDWRLSSRIEQITFDEEDLAYDVVTMSGSTYTLPVHGYGMSGYMTMVLQNFMDRAAKQPGCSLVINEEYKVKHG